MNIKEQLLKECEDLGIINIEADNLTEGLIRDAIAAVKESEPYIKKAIEEAKKEEQRKADEYKSSLLKEAADFCDRIIGKQQKDETITRGQLEDIIANLFGEFDKLKDRID